MALPKLNDSPKYNLVIPSTGEEVFFRPFLVKEQKVLLLAYETNDKKQVINAIIDTISACLDGQVDAHTLTTFDVDYIFTQMRSKSVGEKVDLKVKCTECSYENPVQINIEEIGVEMPDMPNVIDLGNDISVKLKYPTYGDFLKNKAFFESSSQTELVMEIIIASMESVMTQEENISLKDETREEIVAFLDSMTTDQFEKISEYVQNMPVLSKDIEFTCQKCSEENKSTLRGIDDFF